MRQKLFPPQPLLRSAKEDGISKVRIKTEKKFGVALEQPIICRQCAHTITTAGNIISVDGSHTHTFTNPADITYDIGCFSLAEGCLITSDPSTEFTWFEGFSWRIALCSSCTLHLGWYYESDSDSFFGLILDRLLDGSVTH